MSKDEKSAHLLDCSARFYPIIATKRAQSLFHIAFRLGEDVDAELLGRALEDVLPLFPTFKTKLKAGYAWHKLQKNDAPAKIFEYEGHILTPLDRRQTGGYLFRLSARGNEVHLDFFHGLSDANGALAFLLAVIRRMRQLEGKILPDDGVADVEKFVPDDECDEDAFLRYYKRIKLRDLDLKGMAGATPHRRIGTPVEGGYGYARYIADSAEVLRVAKAADASFTAYVAGVAANVIEELSQGDKKPIVVMIPVNLRAVFPSRTQRNFVLFMRVVIQPQKCASVDDYVAEAKRQLAEGVQKERLLMQLSTTVKGMTHPVMSVVPLCLKRLGARIGRLFMRSRQTIIISNLGKIEIADEYGIEEVVFNLNVSKNNVQNLAVTSYRGKTCFSFTSAIKEEALEEAFAKKLEEQGVGIALLTKKEHELRRHRPLFKMDADSAENAE